MSRVQDRARITVVHLAIAGVSVMALTSCRLTDGWSTNQGESHEEDRMDAGWPKANRTWRAKSYPPLQVAIPGISGAEYVNEDKLCAVCHQAYTDAFEHNVHRQQRCEACHGPASKHLETRGKQPGMILSFETMKRAERAEVCAQCHDQNACAPGADWRTSAHAHHGVACTHCHTNHYDVPEGTPKTTVGDLELLAKIEKWRALVAEMRTGQVPGNEDSEAQDSETQVSFTSQRGPSTTEEDISHATLAGPRTDLPSLQGTSHALNALVPLICYNCHVEKYELEAIAHPHQINGPNGFNCTTCHDSHGNVLETSRKQLCLECHNGSPTAAWHSSVHDQQGVACTDCHDPHPRTGVSSLANIDHTSVRRPQRLPMSVSEPDACYKCHEKIFGMMQLPSHHPILEGKMVCSSCHDPHGQDEGNLKGDTVNMVCYKCHADKQGPFVYEHAPVSEDCSICHEPHGTVANNLLRQPATFLCLRCHAGHNAPPSDHFGMGTSDIDGNPALTPTFYTNCTDCHSQVHGSDLPSQHRPGALMR